MGQGHRAMTESESINPHELLAELRWTTDRVVTNPFGERVWLKEHPAGGLTDCCPAEVPCDYHARLTHGALNADGETERTKEG